MDYTSRSNTGSSSKSSAPPVYRGSRIETFITDREGEEYTGDPQDMGTPAFTRTGSFVSNLPLCNRHWKAPSFRPIPLTRIEQYRTYSPQKREYEYLEASDVRRQVREAPSRPSRRNPYPKYYGNKPPLDLQAQPPYREYPVVPTPTSASSRRNYGEHRANPGPVRAFYNENDRDRGGFDVGFHDARLPTTGPRDGAEDRRSHFSLATYREAPTYTDTATLRRR